MTAISRRFTVGTRAATAVAPAIGASIIGLEATISEHREAVAEYDDAGGVPGRMEVGADTTRA
jgi:formiminotetrahydrofolate cyclodeaminase